MAEYNVDELNKAIRTLRATNSEASVYEVYDYIISNKLSTEESARIIFHETIALEWTSEVLKALPIREWELSHLITPRVDRTKGLYVFHLGSIGYAHHYGPFATKEEFITFLVDQKIGLDVSNKGLL